MLQLTFHLGINSELSRIIGDKNWSQLAGFATPLCGLCLASEDLYSLHHVGEARDLC